MEVKVVGVSYNNADGTSRSNYIGRMSGNELVKLEREPQNSYDRYAVKVMVQLDGVYRQIGYLSREIAADISPALRMGTSFNVSIDSCGIYEGHPYCHLTVIQQ